MGHVSVFWLRWCGRCWGGGVGGGGEWVGGLVHNLGGWGGVKSVFVVSLDSLC